MKIYNLAIILARKGSKRLKNKNFKILKGKPLIYWTILRAKQSKIFNNIIVSTDSKKIKNFSISQNILCPWLRPKKLSLDKTKSETAALHALKWYEKKYSKKVDCITLLQPTSPFRTIKNIRLAFKLYIKHKFCSVVAVNFSTKKNIKKLYFYKKPFCHRVEKNKNYKNKYEMNGNIFIINAKKLKNKKNFSDPRFIPIFIKSKKESLDIDTKEDFNLAKKM